jgi:hypothetical protein
MLLESPLRRAVLFAFIACSLSVLSAVAAPIDVSQLVFPVKQPTKMSCWAAATTMLYSWKQVSPQNIDEVLALAGQKYVDIYKADKGIKPADEAAFYKTFKLHIIQQQNLTIKAWGDILKASPLSVTVDADPGKGYIHALVVSGLKGDGTADGTKVTYVDPADGKFHTESFSKFLTLYEGSASWPLQIIYW